MPWSARSGHSCDAPTGDCPERAQAMKVLVVGSLPPPERARSEALRAEVVRRLADGDTVEIVAPDPVATAHRYLAAGGLPACLQVATMVSGFDSVIVQLQPGLPVRARAGRLERSVCLFAFAVALRRAHRVEVRLERLEDLPGGAGGRVALRLWRCAERVVTEDEEQRARFLDEVGRQADRLVVTSRPAAEVVDDEGAWADGGVASVENVLELVRRRAARRTARARAVGRGPSCGLGPSRGTRPGDDRCGHRPPGPVGGPAQARRSGADRPCRSRPATVVVALRQGRPARPSGRLRRAAPRSHRLTCSGTAQDLEKLAGSGLEGVSLGVSSRCPRRAPAGPPCRPAVPRKPGPARRASRRRGPFWRRRRAARPSNRCRSRRWARRRKGSRRRPRTPRPRTRRAAARPPMPGPSRPRTARSIRAPSKRAACRSRAFAPGIGARRRARR